MKKKLPRIAAALTLTGLFGGVMGCGDSPRDEALGDELGALALTLETVPADALCLRISLAGARPLVRDFSLVPGQAPSFLLDRLPAGLVTVDAAAFAKACPVVTAADAPSYVGAAPVTVRIDIKQVATIALRLLQNGRLNVGVAFEGGAPETLQPTYLAVLGDTPYGAAQVADFPNLVAQLNADARLSSLVHVGDIKNGSTRCDDAYFQTIAAAFATLQKPLHYTLGDNEWTDCHRANNGAYDPLERLAALRNVFFADPATTLGAPSFVLSQATVPAHATFVENQLWSASGVTFATVHAVGSANGLAPWFGTDTTGTKFDDPARRIAEVNARINAALDWIDRTFDVAQADGSKGVAVFMQADTFLGATAGFEALVTRLADRARAFARPVLLVQGDSHSFVVDKPLASGSSAYGITAPVPNLTRVVVQGETTLEWLLLQVDPRTPEVFSWERIVRTPDGAGGAGGASGMGGGAGGASGMGGGAGGASGMGGAGGASGRLVFNEISSNPNPDWVEFINPGASPVDLSGWYFTDNAPESAGHKYFFTAGTVVPAGGLLVLDQLEGGAGQFDFGLGNGDAAVLHDASGAIVDQHTWTAHVTSVGRCPDGTGPFVSMTPSKGAPNTCP